VTNAPFALTLQRLPSGGARVLVLGQLAGARNTNGWFGPADVDALFEALRVPAPGNVSQELARLRANGLVRNRRARPSWSLTPEGNVRAQDLIGEIDPAIVASEAADVEGALLGHAVHTVLPPSLAPLKWARSIHQMLEEFDFASNVFCMTRFPADPDDTEYLDPVAEIVPVIRNVLLKHGLFLHAANERKLDEDLFGNVAAHMWACRYGVALFEDRLGRGLNKNMAIEMGSMLITGRRCLMLKDRTIEPQGGDREKEMIPTDFIGQIYDAVDFDDLDGVAAVVHRWAGRDLGLGRCPQCPPDPHDESVR
jgi:hypothetical protein